MGFAPRWLIGLIWVAQLFLAAAATPAATRPTADYVPAELSALTAPHSSELRELVERFVADRADLQRFYSVPESETRRRRLREFYLAWQGRIGAVEYPKLGVEGRIDLLLLENYLRYQLSVLGREEGQDREISAWVPFAGEIARLQEKRRLLETMDPEAAAAALERIRVAAQAAQDGGEKRLKAAPFSGPERIAAARALRELTDLKETLADWFRTFDGYDPVFTWWARETYRRCKTQLDDYEKWLRDKALGSVAGAGEPIIGDPIGAEGLKIDLAHEMIAYTPAELIGIANREFAWCDTQWRQASREMGCGSDWKAALAKVKADHVPPGQQPYLVRDLALEAVRFVGERNLITVPPLAADFWRVIMMTPAEQKVSPFFLGGRDILVAYPTDTMEEEEKAQILRANNIHFARATVFHELIPGHHLQSYYGARVNEHRALFTTPFWVEGWSLWWEFHLWDLGFAKTPQDRIGMLFWRSHRCARIIFSLKFHLGEWTPQQCVDFLVDRVGHERASAEAEVRRSLNGTYPPLYQAGYMLGALQLRELYGQFVVSGRMTERQFHDAILAGGPMPIELVRARLAGTLLPRDFQPAWRF